MRIKGFGKVLLSALFAVAVLGTARVAEAQTTGSITGLVLEQGTQRPIPGAQVVVQGTGLQALTNEGGRYLILNVPAGPQEVRVQTIGFSAQPQSVTVRAGEATTLNFTLQQQAIALDEVVVTGTAGTQVRRAQPAVIATVGAADIVNTAPVKNVAEILTARTPGVSIVQSSGSAGTAQQIRIRGAASINLSNEPLVYVDGVLMDNRIQTRGFGVGGQAVSRLNDINPEDIESIEIVKGPAAATLYGADASAGVIQIITKRGRIGGERFSQTITAEFNSIDPNFTPPANYFPCTAANIANAAAFPNCQGLQPGELAVDNPLERYNVYTRGSMQSLNWTGRGGGQNYGYFLSVGSDAELGTLPNNEHRRRSGRFTFNFTPRENLAVEGGFNLNNVRTTLPDNDNNGFGFNGAMLGDPRTAGDGIQDGWFARFRTADQIARLENGNVTVRSIPTMTVRYTPLPWLSNRLTVGADISRSEATAFVPRTADPIFSPRLANGDITQTNTNFDTYTIDYLGNIRNRFGVESQISSDLSFGVQVHSNRDEFVQANGNGLVTNAARAVSAAAERTGTHALFMTRRIGYLAQWQGGLHDRLFVQLGGRVDQNSSFGRDAEAVFLPKAGISWVVSEEPFWGPDGMPLLNTLRVRAAWGQTGRSPSPGAALETFAAAPFALTQTTTAAGVVPLNPGNINLLPERGEEFEFGLDAGFFDERIGVELTWFNKTTRDLLLVRPLPPSLGFTANPWQNLGEVVNRGLELGINAQVINARNFGWDARLNLNTLHNELTSLGGVDPFNVTTAYNRHAVGHQLGSFFTLRSRDVVTQGGDERCPLTAGQRVPCVIVSDTLEFMGNLLPTLEGSLSSNVSFMRNFRLYAQIDWKTGHTLYNGTDYFRETQVPRARNRWVEDALSPEERLRRFGPFVREGLTAPLQGTAPNQRTASVADMKEAYMQRADFARLREVSLTFMLPQQLAQTFRATNASLSVAGRNLALWTDYEGVDPEVISGIGTLQWLRQEFLTVPPERRWLVRMNFGF
jgi:TonB-dependent starch-binding outer membrane protein SusC